MYLSVIDSQELEDMWSEGELHVNRNVSLPSSLDWREKGWVAQVKILYNFIQSTINF